MGSALEGLRTDFLLRLADSENTPDKPGRNILKLKMIDFNVVTILD